MNNAADLVAAARGIASHARSWADLSNALFAPDTGLIACSFPGREQREAFLKTREYAEIRQVLRDARLQHGLIEGATPLASDSHVVRLPAAVHAALQHEAEQAGVTLHEVIVNKLSGSVSVAS